MKRRLVLRVAVVAALLVLAVLAVPVIRWGAALQRPYAGWQGKSVAVDLEPGLSAGEMLERLVASGVLRDREPLRLWLRLRGGAEGMRAGEYRFQEAISPLQVLDKIRSGDVVLYPVTIPEGLWLEEAAERLAEAGFGPQEELLDAFRDPSPIHELDPAAETLEGYLFPDTYHLPRGVAAPEIARTMVERFIEVAHPGITRAAEERGLGLREAVTLASMIEKETSVADERGRISRVFHNRLERRMRMQCDPTVRYAWHLEGDPVERLTYDHLELDSPWNTYRAHGLPPGPIASPGLASLEAAVTPVDGDELYFVAAPGGGHRFSNDLAGHQRAVREWRRYVRSSR